MKEETLVRNLIEHQRTLQAMLLATTGNATTADDLFQEAAVIMTRKRQDMDETGNFLAWARAICMNVVRDYRKKTRRQKLHFLADESLESLATAFQQTDDSVWEQRRSALRECTQNLSAAHQDVLKRRYEQQISIEAIASSLAKSRQAVDVMLFRLRESLSQCVAQRLRSWGTP